MKPEFPKIDKDRMVSPHAQEIEYALILQRMIATVKEDPQQLRLTIYEFARARLKIDTSWAEESERKRLAASLETAIQGVEEFSARREEKDRLPPANPQVQLATGGPPAGHSSMSIAPVRPVPSAPPTVEILEPQRIYRRPDVQPVVERGTSTLLSTLARFCIGVLLFAAVATLAYHKQRLPAWPGSLNFFAMPSKVAKVAAPSVARAPQPASAPADANTRVAPSATTLPFPVPTDYGIYALSNTTLSELFLLPERVPDKRIAVSTPVDQPSRTILPDGKVRFILFRRDLVGNAPDRIEVRVVARVVRALTFDAKGTPNLSPVSDIWNIRDVSHEFRVRPITGNPEMLLVQPDKPDFALSPGRYVLVLREQGYDFTVSGKVTDLAQCLERTDAANGSFYSECLKM
jgi:hypothetical protein